MTTKLTTKHRAMNNERLKNGKHLGKDYFTNLLSGDVRLYMV